MCVLIHNTPTCARHVFEVGQVRSALYATRPHTTTTTKYFTAIRGRPHAHEFAPKIRCSTWLSYYTFIDVQH